MGRHRSSLVGAGWRALPLLGLLACAPAPSRAPRGLDRAEAAPEPQLQHWVHARANLEFADSADTSLERWPQAPLDSIARALAVLERVDSLSRVELGPQEFWTRQWSAIAVSFGYADAVSTRPLRACVVRTGALDQRPQRLPCWPAVDSLMRAMPGAYLTDLSTDSTASAHFRLVVPLPFNRWWVGRRLRAALADNGAHHVLVTPEPALSLDQYARVDRREPPWTYVIERGYGDCPSGCIHRRYYVYRYDPRTRRAWKEREYGDPSPAAWSPTGG